MDRFEILKYSILFEEYIKNRIIQKILFYGVEHSFESIEAYENLLSNIQSKLKKFGKKSSGMKNAIYHSSAKELIILFTMLKFNIRVEIYNESFLKELFVKNSKFKNALTGNKLVRDTCAHPTYKFEKTLSNLSVFTFLEQPKTTDRINHFYEVLKKHI